MFSVFHFFYQQVLPTRFHKNKEYREANKVSYRILQGQMIKYLPSIFFSLKLIRNTRFNNF